MKKIIKKINILLIVSIFTIAFTSVLSFSGTITPVESVQASVSSYNLYKTTSTTTLYSKSTGSTKKATLKKGEVMILEGSYANRFKVSTLHGVGYVNVSNVTGGISKKTLSVKNYKQKNGYYCGPTTCKQVLSYYGVNKTQDELAKALGTTTAGTTMSDIPGVLNKYQSKHKYKFYHYTSKSDFQKKVLLSIANGYPVVIDINTTNYSSKWGYRTVGHFMNISGFNLKNDTLTVDDPHPTYHRIKAYDSDLVYSVVNAHFNKAIIY